MVCFVPSIAIKSLRASFGKGLWSLFSVKKQSGKGSYCLLGAEVYLHIVSLYCFFMVIYVVAIFIAGVDLTLPASLF